MGAGAPTTITARLMIAVLGPAPLLPGTRDAPSALTVSRCAEPNPRNKNLREARQRAFSLRAEKLRSATPGPPAQRFRSAKSYMWTNLLRGEAVRTSIPVSPPSCPALPLRRCRDHRAASAIAHSPPTCRTKRSQAQTAAFSIRKQISLLTGALLIEWGFISVIRAGFAA